jgi:hypothetical protein
MFVFVMFSSTVSFRLPHSVLSHLQIVVTFCEVRDMLSATLFELIIRQAVYKSTVICVTLIVNFLPVVLSRIFCY